MILDLHTYPTFDKSWREYFPHILVPNLEKRIDRKERMQNLMVLILILMAYWLKKMK